MIDHKPPNFLYNADQARALDRFTIEELKIPGLTLMIRAGEAAMRCVQANWRGIRRVVLVCGGGNNAGDAYVLARLLQNSDYAVTAIQVGNTESLSDEAKTCFKAMCDAGVEPGLDWSSFEHAELIVDGLFGVGLDREITGTYADAVRKINGARCPVLSLDVPSGLNGSTGQVMGIAVKAAATVSFMTAKLGLYTGAGPDYAGQVVNADLDTPALAYEKVKPVAQTLTHNEHRHASDQDAARQRHDLRSAVKRV